MAAAVGRDADGDDDIDAEPRWASPEQGDRPAGTDVATDDLPGGSAIFWESGSAGARRAGAGDATDEAAGSVGERPAPHHEVIPAEHRAAGLGTPAPATAEAWPHRGHLITLEVEPGGRILDRGDMGEGRVGQTLEGARVHGIEVLHALQFGPSAVAVDHLVISANGLWVVHAVEDLAGKLERRDLGDWFNADPRLYIADTERPDLLARAERARAAVLEQVVASPFEGLDVRGVLCFGTAPAGWVDRPFSIGGTSVTWRSQLVEPMLAPVLVDPATRDALTHWLATTARAV